METIKERVYRYILYSLLIFSMIGMLLIIHFGIRLQTPDKYIISPNRVEHISFKIPVTTTIRAVEGKENVNLNQYDLDRKSLSSDPDISAVMGNNGMSTITSEKCIKTPLASNVSFISGDSSYYIMDVQLLGFLPLKQIALETSKPQSVLISGKPIGIYVKTMGIMVIDTGSFMGESGNQENPSQNKLMCNDYILRVDGKVETSKKQVIKKIEGCAGKDMVFTIIRNGEVSDVVVSPKKNDQGIYKAGIWIRDSAQGIGTLTYVTRDGEFGALGHGINDYDTGKLMAIERGSIYDTNILSITKADENVPGQITGVLTLDDRDYLGKIEENTSIGIYGILDQACLSKDSITDSFKEYEIAYKQEIKKGKAQICSDVTGQVELYDVEILDVYYNDLKQNQGILLKVVDEDLLEYTGGIVQGMSGSPILQDGKLIGAVTHVFVNDSTKGYGIFIENMIE